MLNFASVRSSTGKIGMFDMKQFISAIDQIVDEKGIPREKIIETIELAIAAAYKKDYGEKGQIIRAKLNIESGVLDLKQVKKVIEGFDEEGYVTGPLPLRFEDEEEMRKETARDNREGAGDSQAEGVGE